MARLTEQTFARLLDHLDTDRERAGERYEDLRRALLRFFEWRRAPFPEEHTDQALDRVARKLAEGEEIRNVGAYCYTVARLVLLEALKGPDSRRVEIEPAGIAATTDAIGEAQAKEKRLSCLDHCLERLPVESRELIVEYYREDKRERIDARRALAERLGVKGEALANRAQRVRDKLESCVNTCLKDGSAT